MLPKKEEKKTKHIILLNAPKILSIPLASQTLMSEDSEPMLQGIGYEYQVHVQASDFCKLKSQDMFPKLGTGTRTCSKCLFAIYVF